jgi:plastocyanin domain-containing protein
VTAAGDDAVVRRAVWSASVVALALVGSAAADPPHVDITITKHGFEPDHIAVVKDREVELAFTRKTDATCAKQVVIELGDGTKITKDLPLDKPVAVRATFRKSGELHYACSMDMVRGVVVVQ